MTAGSHIEILREARKQLGWDLQAQSGHVEQWSNAQWHAAFAFLFCTDKDTLKSHSEDSHDDLLFFVYNDQRQPTPDAPFTVRRKTAGIPQDFALTGSHFKDINWQRTCLLNLVLQSSYQLTVIACSQDLLPQVAEGLTSHPSVIRVTKRVYASPSHTPVNIGSKRPHALPAPSYPDICFAVDGFDDSALFQDMVLAQPDDCYCVMLHALRGPTMQHLTCQVPPSPSLHMPGLAANQGQANQQQPLFSGYVQKNAVDAYLASQPAAPKSPAGVLGWLFAPRNGSRSRSAMPAAQSKVVMNGPGGVGKAEVAVSHLQPQEPQQSIAQLPGSHPPNAGHNQERLQAGGSSEPGPLHAAIMLMAMPVDALARSILDTLDWRP